MAKLLRSFDVCIVCALSEEARAFLEVVRPQCEGPLEERISPRYHYSYRFAMVKNNKDETLNLHVSWLPRYGPQEMTLHLSRVLEECQPRIAIMTGICAGDARHVQLGDLVVAERTFTYDNGKFTLDDDGRKIHLYDTMTYQLDPNILQFLRLFDEWKSLVARLKRPSYPPEQRKRRKTVLHLKAMASGNAVRADHPFEDVRAPVRGTVAIDMEGAAFGLVMSRHPLISWLVVKGVCDYADRNKNDAYHDYAARASALYAFSFIRAYVTDERLPRPDESSPSSRAGPPGVWNVPYRRNPHFTGRDDLLDRLHQQLTQQNDSAQARRVALTQPLAIKGPGGIGKTQIAVEYAYRSREQGHYMYTLWVNAASEETIITSLVAIAELLPSFSAKSETDQRKLVEAVKRWLEQCEQPWLLIFDNVDNTDDLPIIQEYLPQEGNGSILLTTRAQAVGSLATSIEVDTMGWFEGTQLLLRRAQRFEHASDEEINRAGDIVVALDHFPLALDQAGAYIEETQCSFEDYLDLYRTHRQKMFARRGIEATNYPDSVATTWLLSFQKVQQANPGAAELLHLCSFLAPDRIPEELLKDGATYWPASLQQAVADPMLFQQLIADLLKFSLVKRLMEEHALSIHRLVQAVQRDRMDLEMRRQWAERAVRAVNEVFPGNPQDTAAWPQCLRYLDQIHACSVLIGQYRLHFIEATNLLHRTGVYLDGQALYSIAEPLLMQALVMREQLLGTTHPATTSSLSNLALLYSSQGKYAEAEPLLKRTLEIQEQQFGPDHPDTASSLNNLASLYYAQGRYAEAEPLYQRALEIREQQLGSDHPDTASSLNNLAVLYDDQGRYAEAEPLYQRALEIREQRLGPDHPDTASSLNNLTTFYQSQEKYAEVELLYQRALEIREQRLGPDHPDTATSLDNLAGLYQDQGKYEQAEPLFKRALEIRERRLVPDHPSTATSLNNLALFYKDQGKYAEAEPLFKRALEIREQRPGPNHPDTASSLSNLASLYYAQGKYAEAEPLFKRVLSIHEQQLGSDHPDTAISLSNLALLYQKQEKYEQAESLLKRAIAIDEKAYESDHSRMATHLNNLALLYQKQEKYEQAESLLQRALQIKERQLGPDHPSIATSLTNLANLYYTQGNYEQAAPLLQRALQIQEQRLGPDHPSIATSLTNLANLYYAQGKYEQAEPLYVRALTIRERLLGANHSNIALSLNNLAIFYRQQGEYTEAERLFQRALAIREQHLGTEHPDTARSFHGLAILYQRQDKYEQAELLLKRALAIREKHLGAEHPDTADALHGLAELCQQQGKYEQADALYQRALAIYEQQVGREHPTTQTVRGNYSFLLRTMGRDAEAKYLEDGS